MNLLVPLAQALLAVVFVAVAIVVVRRRRNKVAPGIPGQTLQANDGGEIVIPILAANIGGGGMFGGMGKNSINPKLTFTAEGLAFKVLRQDHWTYAQLTGVDAAKGLLGPTLDFTVGRANLNVTVRDLETARQVLRALPRTVPLSKRAASLRDDETK